MVFAPVWNLPEVRAERGELSRCNSGRQRGRRGQTVFPRPIALSRPPVPQRNPTQPQCPGSYAFDVAPWQSTSLKTIPTRPFPPRLEHAECRPWQCRHVRRGRIQFAVCWLNDSPCLITSNAFKVVVKARLLTAWTTASKTSRSLSAWLRAFCRSSYVIPSGWSSVQPWRRPATLF